MLTNNYSTLAQNVENPKAIEISKPLSNMLTTLSTPESSQTDSDDFSPQISRKRKGVCTRDVLPRFSISIEDETPSGCSSSTENTREQSPYTLQHQKSMESAIGIKNRTRSSIVKSASALGLSLTSAASKYYYTIFYSSRLHVFLVLFS